jgi:hypothetical protein
MKAIKENIVMITLVLAVWSGVVYYFAKAI